MSDTHEQPAVEVTAELVTELAPRAIEVAAQLKALKGNMEANFLDMCALLSEAQEGAYHKHLGFVRFEDWVESGSGLDISSRQAFYYIRISRVSKQLGVSRESLLSIGISKLKEIFSLPPNEESETIKGLLTEAPTASLEEVKQKVKGIKTPADVGKKFITLKLDEDVKDTFDRAVELARMNYGNTIVNGEPADISLSKAVELICVEYLQDINNYPEGMTPATFAPETTA